MTTRPIVDAGPALNFFASGHERLFFTCLGGVSVPETVRDEVLGKAARDRRFRHTQRVVSKLPEQLWHVLPDSVTSDLDQVIVRLERLRHSDSSVGALKIMSTEQVLEAAVSRGLMENRGSMRKIYTQLRSLDDGLPPIESTGLLTRELWRRSPPA